MSHAIETEVISKSATGTVLHASVCCVLHEIGKMAYLNTCLVDGIRKGLNWNCVLAFVSADTTVIVSITDDSTSTHPTFTASHTGSGYILAVGVNLNGTERCA